MKIVVLGAGAIGCHLAYCLESKKNYLHLVTKKKYLKKFKNNGLNLKIFSNKKLKKKIQIFENPKFQFCDNSIFKKIKTADVIFVTLKLKDINLNLIKNISKISNKNTCIIMPCTDLPFWWLYNFFKKDKRLKSNGAQNRYLKKINMNMVGMTMWLSGKLITPGITEIRHVQRGYPIKEVHSRLKNKVNALRNFIKRRCKSPKVKNIYSEIYLKTINSFAFNLIALDTELNNKMLKKNKLAIDNIKNIFNEFDKIILSLKLPITQSKNSRIKQTLTSTSHTLSMLHDYKKGKKVEITHIWKTYKLLLSLSGGDINFSEKIYNKVKKKLNFKNESAIKNKN